MARNRLTDIDLLDFVLAEQRARPGCLKEDEYRVFTRWHRQIMEGHWVGNLTPQERTKLEEVSNRLGGQRKLAQS